MRTAVAFAAVLLAHVYSAVHGYEWSNLVETRIGGAVVALVLFDLAELALRAMAFDTTRGGSR